MVRTLKLRSVTGLSLVLALLMMILFIAGCASTRQTHATTTTTEPTATTVEPATATTATGAVTNQTTTTTTERVPERHSLFGGLFYAVGEVVALPFKLIGGLFDAIF